MSGTEPWLDAHVRIDRGRFSLDVRVQAEHPVLGVHGASGAGKSTLVHAIAGLVRPDDGRISVSGRTVLDRAARIDVAAHRRRVGVVFQDDRLFPHRTVLANLRYGARPSDDHEPVVELLGIGRLLDRRPATLSGGERQRVAIGRALLARPDVLLFDEPLASLDHDRRRRILDHLERIPRELGVPIVYVSHEIEEIRRLTDDVLVLEQGRVLGRGRVDDLLHDDGPAGAFLGAGGFRTVVAGRIVAVDPELGERTVRCGRADLVMSGAGGAVEDVVHASIAPSDVALARGSIAGVSIRNQLPGSVHRITRRGDRVFVSIDVGAERDLVSEVTPRSAESLALRPGAAVVALVKSHAIRDAGSTRAGTAPAG